MAIFHYERSIGKRHKGKNAVFTAAYTRGDKMYCQKILSGKNYNYRKNIIFKKCLIPKDSPRWTHSIVDQLDDIRLSEKLWNMVEDYEKRSDAQLYFRDEIAIPIELEKKIAIELIEKYCANNIAVNGFFCDIAIHWSDSNPYAILLFLMRKLTNDGFSKKIRFEPSEFKRNLLFCRSEWAKMANIALSNAGHSCFIDHRSNIEISISDSPSKKLWKSNKTLHSNDKNS